MALVQFGGGVSSIRGSIAGSTFSKGKGGSVIRNKVTGVNKNTSRQSKVKSAFGALSSSWKALTEADRLTWISEAPNYANKNIFGDPAPLTGFGLYSKLNGQLTQLGSPIKNSAVPPRDLEVATFSEVFASDFTNAISLLELSDTSDGNIIAIYATAPQSPGKRFIKSRLRFLSVKPADIAFGQFDITDAYLAVFGLSVPDLDRTAKIFALVKRVSPANGQASASFKSNGVVQFFP